MCHWRIGQKWFVIRLMDWDQAINAMVWQWSAGSAPDATPYFRVLNPDTQLDLFVKQRVSSRRWIAEGRSNPNRDALAFFDAIPRHWGMAPDNAYPSSPIVSLSEGRARALAAYQNRTF